MQRPGREKLNLSMRTGLVESSHQTYSWNNVKIHKKPLKRRLKVLLFTETVNYNSPSIRLQRTTLTSKVNTKSKLYS